MPLLGKRRTRSRPTSASASASASPSQPPRGRTRPQQYSAAPSSGRGSRRAEAGGDDEELGGSDEEEAAADGQEEVEEDGLGSAAQRDEEDDEEEEERQAVEDGETADEKRVRLTQLYLHSLQPARAHGSNGRRREERQGDGDGGADMRSNERRRSDEQDSGSRSGAGQMEERDESNSDSDGSSGVEDVVSHRLHADLASAAGRRHTSSLAALIPRSQHSVRALRAHRLSVTCTALSSDDAVAWSGSKDGSLVQWDVETAQRTAQWSGSGAATNTNSTASTTGGATSKKRQGVLALSASSDGRLLASAGQDGSIRVWDTRSRVAATAAESDKAADASTAAASPAEHSRTKPLVASPNSLRPASASGSSVRSARGRSLTVSPPLWCEWSSAHRSAVSSLSFRLGATELFSASHDRTVKLFDAGSKAYIETLFGHTAEVQDVHCLYRNRAVSVAADRTARVWKVVEESQLLFRHEASSANTTSSLSLDCCRLLDDDHFLTGGDDGSVALWNINKKRPMHTLHAAHQHGAWVTSIGVCAFSDLALSGSSDGHINVYQCNTANTARLYRKLNGEERHAETQNGSGRADALQLVARIACAGYINSLSCAASGRFVIAGVGQEHRAGRWQDSVKGARNGIAIIDLSARSE